jgi:hypothetical protein
MPGIPHDLNVYPTVIASDETTAVIGVNPKRGFILHSDGAKTELKDLQQLYLDHINLSGDAYDWAIEWVEKEYKKKCIDWRAIARKQYFKAMEEWEEETMQKIYKKYPYLKDQ